MNKNIEIISSGSTPGDISRMVGDNSLLKDITEYIFIHLFTKG